MKHDKIVVNASPIISLAQIGYGDLLLDLSSELVIPQGVYEEIMNYSPNDSAVQWVQQRESSVIRSVDVPTVISDWNLGKGESEVITFAHFNQGFVAALDDRPAKKCAELFEIKTRGTLAVILQAKQGGHIPKVHPLLLKLKANGFRISQNIFNKALALADEHN